MRDSDKFGNQSAMINNETYKYCANIVLINFVQEDADVVSFFNQKSLWSNVWKWTVNVNEFQINIREKWRNENEFDDKW